MRNFSYLKQICINQKWQYYMFWANLSVECEQSFIIWCNRKVAAEVIKISMVVNIIRKALFSNKRFHWKRKRRIGL